MCSYPHGYRPCGQGGVSAGSDVGGDPVTDVEAPDDPCHEPGVDPIVSRSLKVLTGMGAPPRLVRHGELVAEAAVDLVDEVENLGVHVDREWVLTGAVLHDVGKVDYPEELRA